MTKQQKWRNKMLGLRKFFGRGSGGSAPDGSAFVGEAIQPLGDIETGGSMRLGFVLDKVLLSLEEQIRVNNKSLKVPSFEIQKIVDQARKDSQEIVN